MVTALDPVTGLPLVGSTGDINSIPLGQQVFPYDDLDAAGRPSRLPLYPDDVIPVSAAVVGMRKRQPRAITSSLVNDPEGGTSQVAALNVNIAGGAAGSGIISVKAHGRWTVGAHTPSFIDLSDWLNLPLQYGVFAVAFNAFSPIGTFEGGAYNIALVLASDDNSQSVALCTLTMIPTPQPSALAAGCAGNISISYPNPIDPSGVIAGDTANIRLVTDIAEGFPATIHLAYTIIYL